MSKFTKGPWINNGYTIDAKDCCIEIATVTVFNQGKANANLIAAAPDMYKALEESIEIMLSNGFDPDCVPVVKLKYTLKKARGEL